MCDSKGEFVAAMLAIDDTIGDAEITETFRVFFPPRRDAVFQLKTALQGICGDQEMTLEEFRAWVGACFAGYSDEDFLEIYMMMTVKSAPSSHALPVDNEEEWDDEWRPVYKVSPSQAPQLKASLSQEQYDKSAPVNVCSTFVQCT